MNTQIKERRKVGFISGFGILVYRLLERIDGEKGFRLISYRVAQQAKMGTLTLI